MKTTVVTWLSLAVLTAGLPAEASAQQSTLGSGAASVSAPTGAKAPGKIRIGIAPSQAQLGQGNNAQSDYGTSIRNSIVLLMNGPAVDIIALDSHLPMQVQAEASLALGPRHKESVMASRASRHASHQETVTRSRGVTNGWIVERTWNR